MKIKKIRDNRVGLHIFLIVFAVICFLISCSVVPFVFESKKLPPPNLILCFVCCVPAFTSLKPSAVYALVMGLLCDLFVGFPTAFSPIVFLISVCMISSFYKRFSRIGTHVIAVCSLSGIILSAAVTTFASLAALKEARTIAVLSRISVPMIAANFAVVLVLAFIMRLIAKRLKFC